MVHPWLLRLGAAFGGRAIRKQLKKLPPETQRKLAIRTIVGTPLCAGAVGLVVWKQNVEETPITKRERFVYNDREYELNLTRQAEHLMTEDFKQRGVKQLPPSNRSYQRVRKVAMRLIEAIPRAFPELGESDFDWKLFVVDSEIQNAFVFPNGHIYVYTGMLGVVGKDDSMLAFIIGHEMAHALLRHGGEKLSRDSLVKATEIVTGLLFFAFVPFDFTGIAMVAVEKLENWAVSAFVDVSYKLPNSRLHESEADYVGLLLSSAACFDPEGGPQLWREWGCADEAEWLSTHPTHQHRERDLLEYVAEARTLACECGCDTPQAPHAQAGLLDIICGVGVLLLLGTLVRKG